MQCCDYNLISVDYAPLARSLCYIQAASNADLVANCTAQLVDAMVKNYGFDLKKFHVIGFSLGAQIAGLMANFLKSGKFERTTGMSVGEEGRGYLNTLYINICFINISPCMDVLISTG